MILSFLLSLMLLCSIASLSAQTTRQQVTLSDIPTMNVTEQAKFFRDLRPEQLANPNDYIAILVTGMRNPDAAVKQAATGNAAMAMVGLQQLKQQNSPTPVDLTSLNDLRAELSKAIADPNPQTRGQAITALALSDAPNPQIEAALLARLGAEPNGQLRGAILETLVTAGYESDRIKSATVNGLNDPNSAAREKAAKAISKVKPAGALPKLAALLRDQNMTRGFVVEAIAVYGAEARPYLPELEKMLADGTAGGTLTADVQRAIEAIKNPKLAAQTEPKGKAVALVNASQPQPPAPRAATPAPAPPVPTATPAPSSPTPTIAENPAPVVERKSAVWPWLVGMLVLVVIVAAALKHRA